MQTMLRAPVPAVVQQHQEEAAALRSTREFLAGAPHVRLHHLRRIDDRIAAHLDGLAVAGEFGSRLCDAALESPGIGEVFTAAVRAIEDRNAASLARLLSLGEAEPACRKGLLSAFGWVSPALLRGITKELLDSRSGFQRQVGLAACAMHQVDPGAALGAALQTPDPMLRCRGLRVAGQQGRLDLLPVCIQALADADDACRFEAARSALLLGDRDAGVAQLQRLAEAPGPHRLGAIRLLLKVVSAKQAHVVLKHLSKDAANVRVLILGVGVAGDVHYLPWLIQQMATLKLARLAGEAFSMITGLDLAYLDLELKPPQDVEPGPNDDPNDADVAMDEDDSLQWPDPVKISAWWQANSPRFGAGTRYFMGEVPTTVHCQAVLKNGFQRQRSAAAVYLRLLQPGAPLFNIVAPAWRQQRLLANVEA